VNNTLGENQVKRLETIASSLSQRVARAHELASTIITVNYVKPCVAAAGTLRRCCSALALCRNLGSYFCAARRIQCETMKITGKILLFAACAYSAVSAASSVGSFLVTNNDVPQANPPVGPAGSSVTYYSLESDGTVANKTVIDTNGVGVAGGDFAYSRIAIVPQGENVCVFASNAASANIAGISAGASR
jgi:hypothetical protein